jgi:hypothetical protein
VSEVSTVAGGYRYAGALTDTPARGRPGRRRGPLTGMVLEVIAGLDGEATTTEIRRALEASGIVLSGRRNGRERVPDALRRLARTSPPEVMAVGDPRGGTCGPAGQGRAQRWRLAQGGDA